MNGVMIPGASAGSNQVGANEMWTPQVIWPSAAVAGVTAYPTSSSPRKAPKRPRECLIRAHLQIRVKEFSEDRTARAVGRSATAGPTRVGAMDDRIPPG